MARLIGIAYRQASRSPMLEVRSSLVSLDKGLTGDYRGKSGKRQVTLLSLESWLDACEELSVTLPWLTRRSNLLIQDLRFNKSDMGKIVKIGDVELKITRETDPCRRMDQAHDGLRKALQPQMRGGVCCRVVSGGEISVGQEVHLLDN